MFTKKPGKTDVRVHRIETTDACPWWCNPCPRQRTQKEAVGNSTGRDDPDWRCEEVIQFMGLSSGASPKEGQHGEALRGLPLLKCSDGERLIPFPID